MADMRGYSKEFLRQLIMLYRSVPCLWRLKSEESCDRNKKAKAWAAIIAKFREVDPDADKIFAIKKINSMKTSWRRENKKVRESLMSGVEADEVYVPKLWYFELLSFIQEEEPPLEPFTYIDESEDGIVEYVTQLDNEATINEGTETSTPFSNSSTPSTSSVAAAEAGTPDKRTPSRKRMLEESTEVLSLIKDKLLKPQETPCRFDILGRNWAEKLKILPNDQRIYAEKLVNDVLFEAELGTLNRNCSISIQAPSTSAQQANNPTNQD